MKQEYKGVVVALIVIFILAMIPILIGVHNDNKSKHRVVSPERRVEMIKFDTELGLDECRDAILYLQMAGQEREAERRASKLGEAWQNLFNAAVCFYCVDKNTGKETNAEKILDDLMDDLTDEMNMYEEMPYGEKVMKKPYTAEIQRIWDVIDIYYE